MTTRNFLQDRLNHVFEDFKNIEWCRLNEDRLNIDAYRYDVCQQKYILKYYAAYFCEYYGLYESFFEKNNKDAINVISVGCGPGIDCDAMQRVISDNNLNLTVNYLGVDIVDWNYRVEYDGCSYTTKGIDSITQDEIKDIDLIVFPKSLTEISSELLDGFAQLINNGCAQDKIFFMCTYVTDDPSDSNRVDGVNQFQTIARRLSDSGYTSSSRTNEWYYKTNQGWLGHNFGFFKIPDEIAPAVSDLETNCAEKQAGDEYCEVCDISFIPVFKSNYLAYNLIEFSRG